MATSAVNFSAQPPVNLDSIIPPTTEDIAIVDGNSKCKLAMIAILAIVIIVVVSIVAASVEYEELEGSDGDNDYWYDYYYDNYGLSITYQGLTREVCGTRYDCDRSGTTTYESSCFEDLNSTNCAYLCATQTYDNDDVESAFYIEDVEQCYCYTSSQRFVQDYREMIGANGQYCTDSGTDLAEEYSIDHYAYY